MLLAASDHHLPAGQAAELTEYVRGGGGLVLLHGTLANWVETGGLAELAGWAPTGPAPLTELVIRPDASHPLTQRLGPEITLTDELYLSEGPPSGAEVFLRTSWHFTDQVVAYERRFGAGRFVHIGLGHEPATYEDVSFQKLMHRALLFAAGQDAAAPVGVGLIGYGAIASAHATSITTTSGLRLRAICEVSNERREQAARDWAVPTHSSTADLFEDPDVELVVVGTPPSTHADVVLAALAAGKHVVCEKPFALRVHEVDSMIDSAALRDRVLTVFQSRRWDPDFIAMRDVVRSGRRRALPWSLSSVAFRIRDYWHSHEAISGGTI